MNANNKTPESQYYYIKTFGCAMNHSDSERIAAILEKNNFKPTLNINKAGLVVFNTCGVRQMAEDRVYGQIHNLKIKNQKSKIKIVVTGCLADRPDVKKRLESKVDLFFPINNLKMFENWIIKNYFEITRLASMSDCESRRENLKSKISAQNNPLNNERIAYLSINPKRNNKHEAFVPIMTGCNNFCAYCVVPHARGREISRPSDEIIKEIKDLVKNDCKHIVLLGQNVNSYSYKPEKNRRDPTPYGRFSREGSDPYKIIGFSQLLKKINALPGKFWISFMSNHPKDVTDEMIEAVAKCKKVCECFHLPIQSGNDEIIKKMNRKYTTKEYLKIVAKIKKDYKKYKPTMPFAITSDIIVGFPSETRRQFLDSAEIMKKVKYDMVYLGQFSPRPDTTAWDMKDNVSKAEKVRRETYLNEILKKTANTNNKKYVGKVLEVLIEKSTISNSRESENMKNKQIVYFGKTRTMKNVKICSDKKGLIGKIIRVKIHKANVWNLEGAVPLVGGRL